jgi:hypothetical protein
MTDKSEESYHSLFNTLAAHNLDPLTVMSDFEKAAQNALQAAFPNATISGCFFHLGQCVFRKVQELGLQRRYMEDADLRTQVKLLPALALLPPADVIAAFDELHLDAALDPLYDYYEDTFIGRQRRGRRAQPRFAIATWNIHDRVADGLPRTNNSVEGWHRAFNKFVAVDHPSVYHLIGIFHKEQKNTENLLAQMAVGRQVVRNSRAQYVQVTRRLETLLANYDSADKMPFLNGVAHNLDL